LGRIKSEKEGEKSGAVELKTVRSAVRRFRHVLPAMSIDG
jgi:hypothetical protein